VTARRESARVSRVIGVDGDGGGDDDVVARLSPTWGEKRRSRERENEGKQTT